jgi:hypothetical protein
MFLAWATERWDDGRVERDPFRPQDPWKADWDQHTQRYKGDLDIAAGRHGWLVLLGIWAVVIGVVVLLSFVLSTTATVVVALIAFLLLLLTVRA